MSFRKYVILWVLISLALVYEYYSLNFSPHSSVLIELKNNGILPGLNPSPDAGRPISLTLGWTGIGLLVFMNVYSLRKRLSFMKSWGPVPKWLDFHIFCGLLGPTFIIFHTNFKVGGLVAISFWSMVITATSGVVGRYFYVQLLRKAHELDKSSEDAINSLAQYSKTLGIPTASAEAMEQAKRKALIFVGGRAAIEETGFGVVGAFLSSLVGDFRLMFQLPRTVPGYPAASRAVLANYAVARRRIYFYQQFQKLLGYWHAFHFPFAIFMYVVAVIHITAALMFGVTK